MARPILPLDPEDGRSIPGLPSTSQGVDVEVEPDNSEIVQNEDGSADLVEPDEEEGNEIPFEANLAEEMEEEELQSLASELLRKIENDKEARKKRDEQYEEGLKRTGMGQDAPGGASFQGASRAVHPMLAEGCVDFAASAMKELYPPNGPAKTKIEGEATRPKLDTALRQERYLNWQLTEQMTEYPEELETCLTQVPMGGSQYMKFWQDGVIKRPTCEFVPIDDVYIPYSCNDFYSAPRITHVQRLTEFIYEERVENGFYRDVEVGDEGEIPEASRAEQATMKIEGKTATTENVDEERNVFEVNTYAELSVDGEDRLPYLISIDEKSQKIVAIYRNWEEDDPSQTRLEWMVEFGFISWRGAYKIGLPHLIGGLSAAATGALRALLDSAHINTLPGFLRLKGARLGGQSKTVDPAQGVEIEASVATDDIKKLIMPLPYNQPSPTLFQLLGWLTEAAKGVVTTAEEKISEASNQMPVGTALALIEQGSKVYSSIHARLHRSQRRAFAIIARLNGKHLSVSEQMTKLGEVLATKEDFRGPLSVIPVSDPNIFSDTQRFAQMQMVQSLAFDPTPGGPGHLHNQYNVLHRLYEIAKIPEIDELLPKPKDPTELNAAAENSAAMMGTPILAFPEQDQLAHIETHVRFMLDPFLGGSPAAGPKAKPVLIEHIKQHLAFLYSKTMFDIATHALGVDLGQALQDKRMASSVDQVLAAASRVVHAKMQQTLAPLGPVINQVVMEVMKMQPPPPMDPSQAAIQATQIEAQSSEKQTMMNVEQKKLADQSKTQTEQQKLGQKAQTDEEKLRIEQEKVDIQRQAEQHRAQAEGAKLMQQGQAQQQQHQREVQAQGMQQDQANQQHQREVMAQGGQMQQAHMQHQRELQAQGLQHQQANMQHQRETNKAGMQHEQVMSGQANDLFKHGNEMQKHAADLQSQHVQHQDQMGMQKNEQKMAQGEQKHQQKMAGEDLKLRKKEANKPQKPPKK